MKYTKLDNLIDKLFKEYGNELLNIIEFHPEEISEDVFTVLKEIIQENYKPKEIKTIDDLAKLLNGNYNYNALDNQYDLNVEKICEKNKWIILFPYSDDNLEIRGYIDDEIGAWDGGDYKIIKKGDFYKDNEMINTYHKAEKDGVIYAEDDPHIFVRWEPKDKAYVWYIDTDYTNVAYFDMNDEDEDENVTWARCCIIDCSTIL